LSGVGRTVGNDLPVHFVIENTTRIRTVGLRFSFPELFSAFAHE